MLTGLGVVLSQLSLRKIKSPPIRFRFETWIHTFLLYVTHVFFLIANPYGGLGTAQALAPFGARGRLLLGSGRRLISWPNRGMRRVYVYCVGFIYQGEDFSCSPCPVYPNNQSRTARGALQYDKPSAVMCYFN